MKSYQQIKKNLLKNKNTLKAYKDLGSEFALVEMIIKRRLERGLTQAQLARKIGTKQSAIARLESGAYNPSIKFLSKVAIALDAKLFFSIR
ncbi:MAG: helix-turn-helix transcriptional regulator [Patescibacteria group bacterium]